MLNFARECFALQPKEQLFLLRPAQALLMPSHQHSEPKKSVQFEICHIGPFTTVAITKPFFRIDNEN